MVGDSHEVNFEQYCLTCRYWNKDAYTEPCFECLGIPVRPDSRKPEKWEERTR